MSQHITVLLNEAIEGLAIKPNGIYVDGTFGRGGHSRLILSKLGERGRLIALDRDSRAIEEAKKINDSRFTIIHDQFSNLEKIVHGLGLVGKIDGILLDLGVSSPQLDEAERGFSFMKNGPLDMRMDPTKGVSASDWLSQSSEDEITWVLKNYGEERYAKKIAKQIVLASSIRKIETTHELAELIKNSVPFQDKHKHPATRSFQAIRIQVNDELKEIELVLQSAFNILAIQGRLAVISFHSLEDRMIKNFIAKMSKGAVIPKGLPLTEEQISKMQDIKFIKKGKIKPSSEEIKQNPRSRSAILRIAEKI